MCADDHQKPRGPGLLTLLRNSITNWNQPLPFRVKITKLVRNMWIKAATQSSCCGHAGEPGC